MKFLFLITSLFVCSSYSIRSIITSGHVAAKKHKKQQIKLQEKKIMADLLNKYAQLRDLKKHYQSCTERGFGLYYSDKMNFISANADAITDQINIKSMPNRPQQTLIKSKTTSEWIKLSQRQRNIEKPLKLVQKEYAERIFKKIKP